MICAMLAKAGLRRRISVSDLNMKSTSMQLLFTVMLLAKEKRSMNCGN